LKGNNEQETLFIIQAQNENGEIFIAIRDPSMRRVLPVKNSKSIFI